MSKHIITRSIADTIAKLNASFGANERRFAESQAKFQANVEARNAKFDADLDALVPLKPVAPPKQVSSGKWVIPRKLRRWMNPSETPWPRR